MRIAFTLFGGGNWTGGLNYLENLLAAIDEYGQGDDEVVLFVGDDADKSTIDRFRPYLPSEPVRATYLNKGMYYKIKRSLYRFVLQRDVPFERICREHKVDLVFQHQAWYGLFFKIPTLAWIADFQHRKVPSMFSISRFLFRDIGYRALSFSADRIMVSSDDAKEDCETYYPKSKGKISVLKFVTRYSSPTDGEYETLRIKYKLPSRYIYLPNQFWKHKNHLLVVDTLINLKAKNNTDIKIVISGKPEDLRHPNYPEEVLAQLTSPTLASNIAYLGFIPYEDILPLMRNSVAVLNPSFCEGWSTTVEEAKSLQVHLVLSDIPIHKEQASSNSVFFDPIDKDSLGKAITAVWDNKLIDRNCRSEDSKLLESNKRARAMFFDTFKEICENTVQSCCFQVNGK